MAAQGGSTNQVVDGIMRMASEQEAPRETESRDAERHPYHGHIALILLDQSGNAAPPVLLQTEDISTGGIGVISRHMFHTDSTGAVQMIRSDGKTVIIGVKVKHCRYAGDLRHRSGFEFVPIPMKIKESHFLADDGKTPLIYAMLANGKPT